MLNRLKIFKRGLMKCHFLINFSTTALFCPRWLLENSSKGHLVVIGVFICLNIRTKKQKQNFQNGPCRISSPFRCVRDWPSYQVVGQVRASLLRKQSNALTFPCMSLNSAINLSILSGIFTWGLTTTVPVRFRWHLLVLVTFVHIWNWLKMVIER